MRDCGWAAEAHQLEAKRAVSALSVHKPAALMCASVVFIAAYCGSFYMLNPAWWQSCSPLKRPPPGWAALAARRRSVLTLKTFACWANTLFSAVIKVWVFLMRLCVFQTLLSFIVMFIDMLPCVSCLVTAAPVMLHRKIGECILPNLAHPVLQINDWICLWINQL